MQKMLVNKVILIIILVMMGSAVYAQHPANHYHIDLIKHYMSLGEFDLAREVADSNPAVDSPDSLLWLKGHIYKVFNEPQIALEEFIKVVEISDNADLQKLAYNEIMLFLDILDSQEQIELYTKLLENVDGNLYITIYLKLAELYEENYLYDEANDIYKNQLQVSAGKDTLGLRIKIATNEFLQKNYSAAVEMAEKVQAIGDSVYQTQALFIEFMGYYSQNENKKALNALLELYINHKDFAMKFEIYLTLAGLLIESNQYLPAWFVIDEYLPYADDLQRQLLIEKRNEIIMQLQKIENQEGVFKSFKPNFKELLPAED